MLIGRVIGDITATRKDHSHEGKKILLVQPLELDGSPRGNPLVAVDAVEAGIGDRVLLATDGYAAFTSVGLGPSPIDVAVLGVIDRIELDEGTVSAAPRTAVTKKQNKKNPA